MAVGGSVGLIVAIVFTVGGKREHYVTFFLIIILFFFILLFCSVFYRYIRLDYV